MKLSIITINYNNLEGLKKTAESVISQTWRDFEWILIDGGSIDGSKEYVEQLSICPENNITYWCSERDNGIYNAMNKGIGLVSGERVLFLNSGDWLVDNSVLDNVFKKMGEADVEYGNIIIRKSTGAAWLSDSPSSISLQYLSMASLPHPATFFRASVIKEWGYNESYAIISDWLLCWQLLIEGKSFSFFNCVVSEYNTEGISSKQPQKGEAERCDAIIKYTPSNLLGLVLFYRNNMPRISLINKRKSLQKISSLFYHICILFDRILTQLERIKCIII